MLRGLAKLIHYFFPMSKHTVSNRQSPFTSEFWARSAIAWGDKNGLSTGSLPEKANGQPEF
jgi:hypothetical protein